MVLQEPVDDAMPAASAEMVDMELLKMVDESRKRYVFQGTALR
jgi:hypothetical protein